MVFLLGHGRAVAVLKRALTVSLLMGLVLTAIPDVDAKKKDAVDPAAEAAAAAAKAEAEAKAAKAKEEAAILKALTPVDKSLADLMRKYQSRLLFSPEDAGKLSDLKFKLTDLMNDYPTSPLLAKSLYQAGFLLAARGEYDDAYEILSFLTAQQPQNPYGQKAKVRIYQLEKEVGPDYFQAIQAAQSVPDTSAAKPAAGKAAGKDAAKPTTPKK